jgi:hypothetical protein
MKDDSKVLPLYNEEENTVNYYIEYKRLYVKGRIYALLQPADDLEQLVAFRVEKPAGEEEETYVFVADPGEIGDLTKAWQKHLS